MWKKIVRDREPDPCGYAPVVEEHELKIGDVRVNLYRRYGQAGYSAHAHVDAYCLLYPDKPSDLDEAKRRSTVEFAPVIARALSDIGRAIAALTAKPSLSLADAEGGR